MAGISAQGFLKKQFAEIVNDITLSEQQEINPNIATNDDELLGQINAIFSRSIADVWSLAQAVNDNFNLDKAEGKYLDDLGAIVGVPRLQELPTTGLQYFSGSDGVLVGAGTVIANPITQDRFVTENSLTLTTSSCLSAKYSVKTLQNSTDYTIAVDSSIYTYASDGSATVAEILNGLKALIDADSVATWTATVVGSQLVIESDSDEVITITSTTLIGPDEVTASITVVSEEIGAILAPPNSVTQMITPIGGIVSTTNPDALVVGRVQEVDEDYRLRIKASRSISGKSTVPAITAALIATEGVTSALVYENETMTTDGEGRPAKSFECLVIGGDNDDIAQTIWESKPAGIESFGDIDVTFNDENGISRTVSFSRPTQINLAFRVTYSLYDEESFPLNGEDVIAAKIVEVIGGYGVNKDVIVTRLFGDIYSSVDGIDTLVVEQQELTNPGDTPSGGSWVTTKKAIAATEFASTSLSDIYFVEV